MEHSPLPEEIIDAQTRVRPLYDMLEARARHTQNPLRTLIEECVQRARTDNTSESS